MPEALKREVETKANALVESVLKPKHVQPPPEDPQFNYIEDIATKWVRSYFYFYAHYIARPAPMRMVPSFEAQVRPPDIPRRRALQPGSQRHTGEWMEIFPDLTLDECLAAVRDDPWFQP